MPPKAMNIVERFLGKISRSEGCHVWTGTVNDSGYGLFKIGWKKGQVRAHRYSWELANGKIPEGLFVLHKCDNPICVNPDHLFLGTQADNIKDMDEKGRRVSSRIARFFGEDHPHSRLTEDQVRKIREDSRTQAVIAKDYGVGQMTISRIKTNTTWKHVV